MMLKTADTFKPVGTVQGMTPEGFVRDVLPAGRPVLIKGLVAHWPAVCAALRSVDEISTYLKALDNGRATTVLEANAKVGGDFGYASDPRDFNFSRRSKSISAGIDQLVSLIDHPNPPGIYVQSTPIPDHLPWFVRENALPLLPEAVVPRIWISNRTRAQIHNDNDCNIACVVAGRRRFTLFPPDQVANLYIGPLEHTPSGRAISLADIQAPDFERFPRLAEALTTAIVADLEPGDALYIPKYWWHHVQAVDGFNVLVNYWWGNTGESLENPNTAFLAGLIALKGLSGADRIYWKAMFDHYIFRTGPDPIAHIPQSVQGGLGPHTPAIRTDLIHSLKTIIERAR